MTPPASRRAVSGAAGIGWPWLLAAAASVLSLLRTGYKFNVSNNAFHIPIVLRFAAMPQFADDPFVLSLHHFVSPVYPLLSLIATEANVAALFFVLLLATHLLTFRALLSIGDASGIRGWREQMLLVLLLVASPILYRDSPVGRDSLLIDYFTHTELAQVPALFAIASLQRGRLIWTGWWAGLAFALNAFVGAWMTAPMAAASICYLAAPARGTPWRARLRTVSLAAAAFAVPAAPVILWIALTATGASVDFDYRAYLREYYPYHFFLDAASGWNRCQLAFAVLAGGLASRLIERGRETAIAFAALCGVFGAGIVVGWFVDSRLVLDLHLLRVDGMLVLSAAVFVVAAAVVLLRQASAVALAAAAIACLGLLAGLWPVVAAGMALANRPRIGAALVRSGHVSATAPGRNQRAFLAAALVWASVASASAWSVRQTPPHGTPTSDDLLGSNAPVRDWLDVQRWAREATPARAMFLVPLRSEGFRTGARRRVWVTWKDGATVMWAPWTYHDWHQRMAEVGKLAGPAPELAYACAHGIDYVVFDLRPRQGRPYDAAHAAFLDTWFEVQRARCGVAD